MGVRRSDLSLKAVHIWRASGLTQAAFCRQHGYKRATFSSWVKRHQTHLSATTTFDAAPITNSSIAPLTLVTTQWPTPSAETLQLRLANGVDLTLPTSTCATWLANLLRALT
ncbi:hypothetical protein [Deefgea sp. CFH1-16]|uniref:IS66 family insertion sequence element accessory protein TnpA n=1 Tax=Deefgea sp. CFH1-16 TaxID=2675457 RepID=UPI0015F4E79B|nr:hypothetical protein [Deefgea sp. CFH1-16]MBM5575327.1 hypothetical protein [Deefgea sp. CFH1-16]MBM5575770.1 hypothetical protein [Deefgea sp. CFH1-16]